MKISLCITTFNRSELTIESFSKVYDHELIDEIIIVDDASDEEIYDALELRVDLRLAAYGDNKIKLFRNENNLGMSLNKAEAISKAKNKWVIILDSDNILYPEYLDELAKQANASGFKYGLQNNVIYCPVKAEPDYDFSQWAGQFISKANAKDYLHLKEFRVFINACNYVVNREKYLEVYKYDETIKESDTIYFNQLWLAAGCSFYFVPGMSYYHRRHEGSGWLNGDHKYNLKKAAEIQEKIKNL